MAKSITLITGGVRSGKSSYAESLAKTKQKVCYLATAWPGDEEMKKRIKMHQLKRPSHWTTIEEGYDLAKVLQQKKDYQCILIDCLGMWLSNHMCQGKVGEFLERLTDFCAAIEVFSGELIMVSNEVGWGLLALNEMGREFTDNLGWANQRLAGLANRVILMVAGCPVFVKNQD